MTACFESGGSREDATQNEDRRLLSCADAKQKTRRPRKVIDVNLSCHSANSGFTTKF